MHRYLRELLFSWCIAWFFFCALAICRVCGKIVEQTLGSVEKFPAITKLFYLGLPDSDWVFFLIVLMIGYAGFRVAHVSPPSPSLLFALITLSFAGLVLLSSVISFLTIYKAILPAPPPQSFIQEHGDEIIWLLLASLVIFLAHRVPKQSSVANTGSR